MMPFRAVRNRHAGSWRTPRRRRRAARFADVRWRENVADRAWARASGLAMAPRGRSLWRLPGRGAKRRGRQRPDLGGALRDSQRLAIVIELDWLSVEELVAGAVGAHIDAQPAPAVQEPEDEAVEP